MLARWYMLLGQFSVTFEYRPGAQHVNADGMSRQCGQCMRPGCPVSFPDSRVDDMDSTAALLDQPFASSEMGDSMDTDLLQKCSGETWVAATYMDELKAYLPPTGSDRDFVVAPWQNVTLATVCKWVCGIISGAAVLAASGRKSVRGHGGEVMVSPGPSVDVLSAGRAGFGTTGSHSPFSLLTFRAQFGCFPSWVGFIGRDCVRMSAHIWPHVWFVWPGSLLAHGGLPWDMSRWATDGIGWPWIC